jgi:NAD(P)-dependent dehydrogenase (short-subunit alcohol dehydrogenase family)
VRFSEGLATLLREPGGSAGTVLVEVGPGRTLASLARQQGVTPAPEAIPTLPHPTELESADAFLLGALGRLWLAGADLKWEVFVDGERRQRVALPGYPFQRARHWVARGATNTATASAGGAAASEARGPLTKVPEIADWYWRPTWQAQALGTNGASATNAANASNATAGAVAPAWLLFVDDRGVGAALAQRLKARGEAVVTVAAGTAYAATGPDAFTLPPGARAAYVQLWEALRTRPVPPRAIVHLWNVGERAGASYDSLLWLLQALAGDEQPAALTIVSAGLHSIAGEAVPAPDKALLLGPCLVAPRELPWLRTRAVDLPVAASADSAGAWQRERIVESLLAEVDDLRRADAGQVGDSSGSERVVALRPGGRFVRAFERQRLESSGPSLPAGLRAGGTYLITGGLGGVGLEIAAWLARVAAARLVLLGRSPVPAPSDRPAWLASHGSDHPTSRLLLRLQEMEGTAGIAVLVARADVRDAAAVRAVVEQARARFGRIDGVFHAAGTIDDGLLQLKEQGATDDLVIASKVEGARSLDAALADQPPDLFVLFSSVSSFMGFEGQIDYAAANAFLDAFAEARNARAPGYTVAVNFSAWRDVGMAVRLADRFAEQAHAHGPETRWLPEVVTDTDAQFVVSGMFRRDRDWVLREHVVRDGDRSVMPGTGFVELTRAAAEAAEEKSTNPLGALVLQDLVFVAPLVVAGAEARRLTVSINRSDGQLTIASSAAADAGGMVTAQTHVVGRVAARESGPTPARVDLDAVRARCPGAQPVKERQLDQDFMRFGPRWANLDRIGIGSGEALVDLRLDDAFTGDLSTVPLHPALLDMATGGAQTLIPGFDRHRDFYVPFSYGRVVVHRGLTARLHSHVRHKTAAAGDTAAFDVTLCDSDGAVLVTVTDFVMKRLPASQGAFAATGAAVSATPAGASAATLREAALLHGMTPPEGIEALHRVLARRPGAQIVVSSVDIRRWRAQVDAEAQASAARSVPAATSAISAAGAGAAERPALAAAYVAPTDEWQRLVAGVWQTILGIGGIGIHDNFFELGGHSLLLTQAATRVRKAAGLDLPLSTLFSKLTIAELAADLQRASAAAAGAAPSKVAPLRAVSRDAYRTKRPAVAGGETGGPPPVAATPIPTAPDQKKPEAS